MLSTVSEQKLDSEVVGMNFLLGRQMVIVGMSLRENVFPPVLTSKGFWLCHLATSFCSPDFIPDEVHLPGILKAYGTTKCTKAKEKWYQQLPHGKQRPSLRAQTPL